MDVFIHFPPGLAVERGLIEDALEDALGEAGHVRGAGSGGKGSDVDLYVDDKAPREKVLETLRAALTLVGVTRATIVLNGAEVPFRA